MKIEFEINDKIIEKTKILKVFRFFYHFCSIHFMKSYDDTVFENVKVDGENYLDELEYKPYCINLQLSNDLINCINSNK